MASSSTTARPPPRTLKEPSPKRCIERGHNEWHRGRGVTDGRACSERVVSTSLSRKRASEEEREEREGEDNSMRGGGGVARSSVLTLVSSLSQSSATPHFVASCPALLVSETRDPQKQFVHQYLYRSKIHTRHPKVAFRRSSVPCSSPPPARVACAGATEPRPVPLTRTHTSGVGL